jgi:hypothetical protein
MSNMLSPAKQARLEEVQKIKEDAGIREIMDTLVEQVTSSGQILYDALASIDESGDGELSFEEFRNGLARVGVLLGEEEYRDLFDCFDFDRSGSFEFMEFYNLVSSHKMEIDARTKFISGKLAYLWERMKRNYRRKKMNLPVPSSYKKPKQVHPYIIRCQNLPRIFWVFFFKKRSQALYR